MYIVLGGYLRICLSGPRFVLDSSRFYEEQYHPSGSPHDWHAPKTVIMPPFLGAGGGRHNLSYHCDSSTACRLCRLEPVSDSSYTFSF